MNSCYYIANYELNKSLAISLVLGHHLDAFNSSEHTAQWQLCPRSYAPTVSVTHKHSLALTFTQAAAASGKRHLKVHAQHTTAIFRASFAAVAAAAAAAVDDVGDEADNCRMIALQLKQCRTKVCNFLLNKCIHNGLHLLNIHFATELMAIIFLFLFTTTTFAQL